MLWQGVAQSVTTSLGQFPGPSDVMHQSGVLVDEYYEQQEKAARFYARQDERNAKKLAENRKRRSNGERIRVSQRFLIKLSLVSRPWPLGSLLPQLLPYRWASHAA